MFYIPSPDAMALRKGCNLYVMTQRERNEQALDRWLRREILSQQLKNDPQLPKSHGGGFGAVDTFQTHGPLRSQDSHYTKAGQ